MNEFRVQCAYQIISGYLSLHPGSNDIKLHREATLASIVARYRQMDEQKQRNTSSKIAMEDNCES
jgi:hypothetical protein